MHRLSQPLRIAILSALVVVAGGLLYSRWPALVEDSGAGGSRTNDFVEYWGAGRLWLGGANPYDAEAMLAQEALAGWSDDIPLMMWNPPYVLPLVAPFAVLAYRAGELVWLACNCIIAVVAALLVARFLRLAPAWAALVPCLPYAPMLFCLHMGQISMWLLFGVAAFLWAQDRGHDLAAGAALALLAIKPHYCLLFLLAALYWSVRSGRWRIVIGFGGTLGVGLAIAAAVNPAVLAHYLATSSAPPLYWMSTTLGTWLRIAFGEEMAFLQFLPTVVGAILAAAWLRRQPQPWVWPRLAPPLLLLSAVTAVYGWTFDQVALLPAVVAALAALRAGPFSCNSPLEVCSP